MRALVLCTVAVVLTLLATAGHTTEPEKASKDHIAGVEYESAQAQRNKTPVELSEQVETTCDAEKPLAGTGGGTVPEVVQSNCGHAL